MQRPAPAKRPSAELGMPLRPATLADARAIFELLRQAPSTAQWSESQVLGILASPPSDRLFLVIEERGTLQAFLAASSVADECELENVVVAQDFKRRGLGTRLMAALLDHAVAAKISSIFLEVRASNSPARRLYEKFGFEVASRRPQYYRNPSEDAVLYRLQLRESAS
jgi:[ribosomal protein S18]-alanine N-acetyltransferase